jgi:pyruvate formate lyase activating enzyme
MTRLHEARFYAPRPDGSVVCTLCPHDCHIPPGARGPCAVRYNQNGRLYTLVYDRVIAREVNPIEKKPFFHFLPDSYAYSISTVGCSLRCAYCQNWEISQWPKAHLARHIAGEDAATPLCPRLDALQGEVPGEYVTPESIVAAALASGCQSVSYTFTEPTIFYELAYDTAVLAREQGLRNNFVTNGFINPAPLRQLATVLDAANVDLEFFSDASYRRVSRARLGPILEAIRLYHELGVWVEVTTLVVPGLNDSNAELTASAEFLCSVSPVIPWHVSRFYPAWHMQDHPITDAATLSRAREIGLRAGLKYVYEGNIPGAGGEDTHCPNCRQPLIERYGFTVRSNRLRDGHCPECGEAIEGVWS